MAVGTSELTIDQLAQRTGMSARNIRAHQSRGLLAPPTLRGRTGYYNDEHVARIELIQRLQADGFHTILLWGVEYWYMRSERYQDRNWWTGMQSLFPRHESASQRGSPPSA